MIQNYMKYIMNYDLQHYEWVKITLTYPVVILFLGVHDFTHPYTLPEPK